MDTLEGIFRSASRPVLATLIRLLGDFDLAEDALQDAFTAALETWPKSGLPASPAAWLTTTARRKAIDRLRHRQPTIPSASSNVARVMLKCVPGRFLLGHRTNPCGTNHR